MSWADYGHDFDRAAADARTSDQEREHHLTAFPPPPPARPGMFADRRDRARLLRVAAVGAAAGWGAVAGIALLAWLVWGAR